MKQNSLFTENFIKECLKLLVLLLINGFLNKEVFTQNNVKGQIVLVLASTLGFILYLLISSVFKIVKRPVLLEIKMQNKLTEKITTQILHDSTQREDSRTVSLCISVTKKNSAWHKIALYTLKNKSIKFKISIEPNYDCFICMPSIISDEIVLVKNVFEIDIKELLSSGLRCDLITFNRSYDLIVSENTENPPQATCNFAINPDIMVNNVSLNVLNKLIIDMKIINDTHSVEFYK